MQPDVAVSSTSLRKRDVRADSATGALLVLVILGHVLEAMNGSAAHAATLWIYMFHMPAFVFISGYITQFSRKWSPVKIITRLLFPYIVFALILRLMAPLLTGDAFVLKLSVPPWSLWYLPALMAWRLAAPLLQRIPVAIALGAAVALSVIAAGASWVGVPYTLGRIVGFLPFFVAGLLWREQWWHWLLSLPARIIATVIIVGSAALVALGQSPLERKHFAFSRSSQDLDLSALSAMQHRAAVLVIATVLGLAVISMTMRAISALAAIGMVSLTVYLLQAAILYPLHIHGAPDWFAGGWAVVAAAILSACLAWLFSRRAVVAATRPLMDLRFWQDLFSSRRRAGAER